MKHCLLAVLLLSVGLIFCPSVFGQDTGEKSETAKTEEVPTAPKVQTKLPAEQEEGKPEEQTVDAQDEKAPAQPVQEEAEPEKPYYVDAYIKLLDQYPELAIAEHWARMLRGPAIFLFLLSLIGFGGRKLVFRAYLAKHQIRDRRRAGVETFPWWIHAVMIAIWLFALGTASEAVGIEWVSVVGKQLLSFLGTLIGGIILLVVVCALAGIVAHAFSREGRELVWSILGYFYLRYDPHKPPKDYQFDMGGGKTGTIIGVYGLHTIFQVEGEEVIMPNAFAMHQYYGWAGGVSQEGEYTEEDGEEDGNGNYA